jgi:4-azaleucine resistance transporter AzlC
MSEIPGKPFLRGARASVPIVLGYIPVGIAFGVLARTGGLSPWEATAMSIFVYAGASQFIAVEMLAGGAGFLPIILTTLLVNLRHLLMSSAFAFHLGKKPLGSTSAIAAELTDESFSLLMCRPEDISGPVSYLIGLQAMAQLAWVAGTATGAFAGSLIDSSKYGIPFALPALFICLLILQIKSWSHVMVIMLAGTSALLLKAILPGNWYIILAALLAASAGVLLPGKRNRP